MRRLGQRTLEFERPTILSHGAVGGKREAEGPLGGDFDQTFGDTTLQEESWEKARGSPPKGGRHLGIGKGRPLSPRGGLHPGGGFAQPVHLLHLWAAGFRHPLPGAVRGLLHHGPDAAAGLYPSGERRCGKGPGGDKLPLLLGRAPVPPAFGVRRPARPHRPVDRHRGGLRVGGPGREGPGGPGPGGRHPGFGREGPRQPWGRPWPPRRPPACTSSSRTPATSPGDYDGIFTGDLGAVGSQLLYQCLEDNHVDVRSVHQDCGLLLYDRQRQDVHAGGSGCGCSASVLCGHLLRRMERGELRNILFCATGALMSPTSSQQGQAIPGVCHVVQLLAP